MNETKPNKNLIWGLICAGVLVLCTLLPVFFLTLQKTLMLDEVTIAEGPATADLTAPASSLPDGGYLENWVVSSCSYSAIYFRDPKPNELSEEAATSRAKAALDAWAAKGLLPRVPLADYQTSGIFFSVRGDAYDISYWRIAFTKSAMNETAIEALHMPPYFSMGCEDCIILTVDAATGSIMAMEHAIDGADYSTFQAGALGEAVLAQFALEEVTAKEYPEKEYYEALLKPQHYSLCLRVCRRSSPDGIFFSFYL
ncbi:MAG: hypothetical protein IJP03_06740 [Christensenellaceae bacterium]|nr:hypothetical protein [Christensenellaceae bacterium]